MAWKMTGAYRKALCGERSEDDSCESPLKEIYSYLKMEKKKIQPA